MATAAPARVIDRIPKHGTLQVRAPADLSILELVEGPVSFVDTRNNQREGKLHLRPSGTVVAAPAVNPVAAPTVAQTAAPEAAPSPALAIGGLTSPVSPAPVATAVSPPSSATMGAAPLSGSTMGNKGRRPAKADRS